MCYRLRLGRGRGGYFQTHAKYVYIILYSLHPFSLVSYSDHLSVVAVNICIIIFALFTLVSDSDHLWVVPVIICIIIFAPSVYFGFIFRSFVGRSSHYLYYYIRSL